MNHHQLPAKAIQKRVPLIQQFKTRCIQKRLLILTFSVMSGIFLSSPSTEARELQGRLGVGYNSQFSNSSTTYRVPGISLKYAVTRDVAVEGVFGVSTQSPMNTVSGVKFLKNVFFETNLNFYFMMGGALLGAGGKAGLELIGGLGTEFFIPGLESLGFAFETGGSFNNIAGGFMIKTFGVSFLDAGIHFYF